jgi:glutathione peroxidase-family protein
MYFKYLKDQNIRRRFDNEVLRIKPDFTRFLISEETEVMHKLKKKRMQSRNRPGVTQSVPGDLGSQIF